MCVAGALPPFQSLTDPPKRDERERQIVRCGSRGPAKPFGISTRRIAVAAGALKCPRFRRAKLRREPSVRVVYQGPRLQAGFDPDAPQIVVRDSTQFLVQSRRRDVHRIRCAHRPNARILSFQAPSRGTVE